MVNAIQFFDSDNLLRKGIPKVDYHIHTHFTDAVGSVEEYLAVAEQIGLTSFAITDHIWRTSDWLDELLDEIDSARDNTSLKIFSGVEAKQININGDIDLNEKHLDKLDVILGAVHALPTETDYSFLDPKTLLPDEMLVVETESIISLMQNKQVNVIAHPFRIYKEYFNLPIPYDVIIRVVKCALKNNVAIELNGKYSLPDANFLKIALNSGAKLSFGSDAHKPSEVGRIPYDSLKKILEEIR